MPDLPQFIPADSPDANALQTAPASATAAPSPDFIPAGSQGEAALSTSASPAPAPAELAAPAFIPADATSALQTKGQYLKLLPRDKIVKQYIADGEPADSAQYKDAYASRAAEGNLTGDKDLTGAPPSPDSGLWNRAVGIEQSLTTGLVTQLHEAATALTGRDPLLSISFGEYLRGGRKLSGQEQTQAAGNVIQGTELATFRTANFLRQFVNNAWNFVSKDATARAAHWGINQSPATTEKQQVFQRGTQDAQFSQDVAMQKAESRIVAGGSVLPNSAFQTPEQQALSQTNKQFSDPETVQAVSQSPISDPSILIPGLVSAKGAEAAKVAALGIETTEAPGIVRNIVAKPFEMTANAIRKTQGVIDTSPIARASLATGVALAAGVDSPMGLLTAAALGGEKSGQVAQAILGRAEGVLRNAAGTISGRLPPGPIGQFAGKAFSALSSEGKSIVLSQAANLPFLLGSENEDDFKNMLLVGLYGHAIGAGVRGINSLNFWAPASRGGISSERIPVKDYGIDDTMDAAHQKAMQTADNTGNNVVQGLRNYFGNRRELYVMQPADIEASLNALKAQGAKIPDDVGTPANAKAAGQQAGVVVPVEMPDGTKRTVAYVSLREGIPGLGAGHEVGHLLESIASPEEIGPIYAAIREAYQPAGIAAAKSRYEQQAASAGQPRQDLSEPQVVSELFAENASAVLNAIPIGEFGPNTATGWKGAARDIYALTERFLNKVGAKVPSVEGGTSGPKTGLGYDPSAPVGRLIENLLEAKRLDKATYSTPEAIEAAQEAGPIADAKEIAREPLYKKGDPLDEIYNKQGQVIGTHGSVLKTLGDRDGVHYYEVAYDDPADKKRKSGTISETTLLYGQIAEKDSEGNAKPAATAPEAKPSLPAGGETKPTEPAATNVRTTPEAQQQFAKKATPGVRTQNLQTLRSNETLPRHERPAYETDYFSAKSEGFSPDAVVRKEQRRLADEADSKGGPNPLRKLYQKVFVPYKLLDVKEGSDAKPRVFGFSLDKFIQNADILRGWLLGKGDKARANHIANPNFTETVRKYLENQSHGYGGGGEKLRLPSDTKPGTITPEDKGFVPHKLDIGDRRLVNLLMGFPEVQSSTPANRYFARFARENDLDPTINNAGVEETNPLRKEVKDAGFNTKLLNSTVENLPVENFTTPLKKREDLHFPAGDTGITQAGFMPRVDRTDYDAAEDFSDRHDRNLDDIVSEFRAKKGKGRISWPRLDGDKLAKIWMEYGKRGTIVHDQGGFRSKVIYSPPEGQFMPAQHGGKPLKHSLGNKDIRLVHYGSSGISETDPTRFGRSGITSSSELAGSPRSYFYVKGRENPNDPATKRPNQYEAVVSGSRIYNGDTDELGYAGIINRWKADKMLQDAGYVGIKRSAGGKKGYEQVEMFKPTKVEANAPKFMPALDKKDEKAEVIIRVRKDRTAPTEYHIEARDAEGKKLGRLSVDITRHGKTNADIFHVLVSLENRKQGIGESLYRKLAQFLGDRRISSVTGEVHSKAALRMREKVFGIPTSIREHIFGDDLNKSDAYARLPETIETRDDKSPSVWISNSVNSESTFMPELDKKVEAHNEKEWGKTVGGADSWLDPDGRLHPVGALSHEKWAQNRLGLKATPDTDAGEGTDALHGQKWARVVRERDSDGNKILYVNHTKPLSPEQVGQLTNLAMWHEMTLMSDSGRRTNTLYTPPELVQ